MNILNNFTDIASASIKEVHEAEQKHGPHFDSDEFKARCAALSEIQVIHIAGAALYLSHSEDVPAERKLSLTTLANAVASRGKL